MRLNEKYKDWSTIFAETGVPALYYTPWMQLIKGNNTIGSYCPTILDATKFGDDDIRALDIYLMTHYGNRNVLRWFADLDIGTSDDTAPTAKQNNIRYNLSTSVFEVYGNKWNRLLQVLGNYKQINSQYDYSPTENVFESITETTERTGQMDTANGGNVHTTTGTNGNTDELTITGSHTRSNTVDMTTTTKQDHTVERGVAGFNSSNPSSTPGTINTESSTTGGYNADSVEITKSGNSGETSNQEGSNIDIDLYDGYKEKHKITKDETEADTRTTTTKYGTKSGTTWSDGIKDSRSFERKGNIGVMTSGQILEGEWQARSHLIYKAMCEDLLAYIGAPSYDLGGGLYED